MTLIDTATAAVGANVKDRTIRRWVAADRLKNHGTQRRILIDLEELMNVMFADQDDVR